jgi:SAM-dependent methyltransferase
MSILLSKIIRKIKSVMNKNSYDERINNEINFYKDCHNVHDLPEIFHYWSNKYILPLQKPFGFTNPDDFFRSYCKKYGLEHSNINNIRILSVGSGNGELEVSIAHYLLENDITNFSLECMDINQHMLDRTMDSAKEKGVEKHIATIKGDFNKWKPQKEYHIVLANQSLHHVMELEHLFDSIYKGLSENGIFLTSDMIGRNGHMRWPEALGKLEPFWKELPKEYKYNQLLKRQENTYINHDCSTSGFEGIRAQDILPLLVKRFHFELFIPFANVVMIFIDRPFGHNFDVNKPQDLDFIDRVHAADEAAILSGELKPTQMLAVMSKAKVRETQLVDPRLSPEFCIRKV